MRLLKIQSGCSCWKAGMEPSPRYIGWLVQDTDTVRGYKLNVFAPGDTAEVKLVDILNLNPADRSAVEYMLDTVPRWHMKRACYARNRYFNSVFMKGECI